MLKRTIFLGVVLAVVLVGSTRAEHKDIDLRDYDDELMRDLDRTIKYFEPDITARNVEGATADAQVLQDGFQYTEDFFSKKDQGDDAVQISRRGLQSIAAALEALGANDFEGASAKARETAQTCRACHDIYKPLKK